jgi:hypothetical protein
MSDCASAWTPSNTLAFIFGLIILLHFTGITDLLEEWARKR